MNESPYAPLSCALHDRLEAAATLKRRVRCQYRTTDGTRVEEDAMIADIQTRDGAEYLLLSSGSEVRLDRIEALDGLPFRSSWPRPDHTDRIT